MARVLFLFFYLRRGFHSIAAPFAMPKFEAGDVVLVYDLIESVKYNGSMGVVQGPGRPQRVLVKLQGEKHYLSVAIQKLLRIGHVSQVISPQVETAWDSYHPEACSPRLWCNP